MLALKTLIDLFPPQGFFTHEVAAFGAFFVDRLEVGDEFAFWVVGTAEENAAPSLPLLKFAAAFGAGDFKLSGGDEGFGVFAFGVG